MWLSNGRISRVHVESPLLVLVDGIPIDDARVLRLEEHGPLGRRRARIEIGLSTLHGREVVIAEPFLRADGLSGKRILLRGVIHDRGSLTDRNARRNQWIVMDEWSLLLDREINALPNTWALEDDTGHTTWFRTGDKANLGSFTKRVNGLEVAGFGDTGERWTVGAALRLLLAVSGIPIRWMMPDHFATRLLERDIRLTGTLSDVLERITADHRFMLRWDETDRVLIVSTREQIGRRVALGFGGMSTRTAWRSLEGPSEQRAVRGLARASGWRVESTFMLQPGWDSASQGLPDGRYDPTKPGDFTEVAQVFRRWVLNEDGAYSGTPYNAAAYDLRTLFGDDRVPADPLRLEAPLSLDTDGQTMPALVEISEDSGATWRVINTRRLLTDRAGIVLTADSLGSAYLAAARAGAARCRVTASLRSPVAVEAERWWGNVFSGTYERLALETEERFRFARIDSNSRFSTQVRAGTRKALENDDSAPMRRWLLESLEQAGGEKRFRLERSGRETWLRPGDQVTVKALGLHPIICDRMATTRTSRKGSSHTVIEGTRG